jgi:hypothetical protein
MPCVGLEDPGFGASEDSTCLKPLGYCDRHKMRLKGIIPWSFHESLSAEETKHTVTQYNIKWWNSNDSFDLFSGWGFWDLFYPCLYSPCGPWPLFQFLNLYTVGRAPWTRDQQVARPLPTHRINPQTHPCFEWESNPRSQCSSGRRRFLWISLLLVF